MNVNDEDPPPILGRWSAIYALLAGELLVLSVLFYALRWWAE